MEEWLLEEVLGIDLFSTYQHGSTKGSSNKRNARGAKVSDVVVELARAGRLKSGAAYENMPLPLGLFPGGLPPSEVNKYRLAMRVVSAAVTDDQEEVFRSAEIDDAELLKKAKALDDACRKWIASKLGRQKVGKLTAQVLGLGANAGKLPDSAWPRPTGGLFGGLFSRNN